MAEKWNSKVQFPNDSGFVVRIVGVKHDASKSSGNPMITLSTEVVSLNGSPEVEIGGKIYNIAGVESDSYYVTAHPGDEEKTKQDQDRLFDPETGLLNALQIDRSTVDWANLMPILEPFKGKLLLVQMSPDIVEQTKNPTAAQLEAGKKQGLKPNQIKGDVQKHPVTGKALINYFPKVRTVFALAPQDGVAMPY